MQSDTPREVSKLERNFERWSIPFGFICYWYGYGLVSGRRLC